MKKALVMGLTALLMVPSIAIATVLGYAYADNHLDWDGEDDWDEYDL